MATARVFAALRRLARAGATARAAYATHRVVTPPVPRWRVGDDAVTALRWLRKYLRHDGAGDARGRGARGGSAVHQLFRARVVRVGRGALGEGVERDARSLRRAGRARTLAPGEFLAVPIAREGWTWREYGDEDANGDGDGGVVATCSETEARAWDVERGTTTAKTAPRDDLGTSGARTPERWSPGYLFSMARGDGVLACGCSDGVVRVYGDGSSGTFGERVAEVTAHPNAIVGSTSFIDGGRVLCSVGLDGTVVLTDVRTWGIFRRISAGSTLTSACGVGSGSWLAMVGESGVVRAIDAIGDASSSAQCVFEPKGEPVPLFCVAANESGTMLACSGAGVPSSAPTLGATFGTKTPDPSRLDVWMASSEA